MNIFRKFVKFCLALHMFLITSCTTIESTLDSTWDSISEAGDYIYDSVNFWEETEPEQSEAIIIEEAVEVPDFAMPDQAPQSFPVQPNFPVQPSFSQQPPMQPYYDPIYRSARQYYFVGPNGTPMLAPQPPPFPQYSIDQVSPVLPYSYNNNLNLAPPVLQTPNNPNLNLVPEKQIPRMLTEEEEMELFGIQNNCIQVAKDLVNGGYVCDDFD
ncbi:hypothetical protein OAY92_02585 [Alphaproteobacteria bacterium]|mgnify:CR=1 FL=1|jgi:hypothetical protein|nr:hypothetical protein [Alphaproteobacteria bacterium]